MPLPQLPMPHLPLRRLTRIGLMATSLIALPAYAEEPKPGVISVSATGTASVAPDMAIINLAVVREAKTAREALSENNKAMAAVLAAMKAEGIEDRDLQTSNFNIQPRYFYPQRQSNGEQKPPRITGYIVSNALTVRIRDLSRVGAVLDQSVSLGVNSGGNINFTSENPDETLQSARKNAMQKAIAKATTLVEAAGVSLGRITSISEQGGHRPPVPRKLARASIAADEAAVPVASGENSYTVTVNVTWELDQ